MQDGGALGGGSSRGTDRQRKTADCISWPIKSSSAYQTEASALIAAPSLLLNHGRLHLLPHLLLRISPLRLEMLGGSRAAFVCLLTGVSLKSESKRRTCLLWPEIRTAILEYFSHAA